TTLFRSAIGGGRRRMLRYEALDRLFELAHCLNLYCHALGLESLHIQPQPIETTTVPPCLCPDDRVMGLTNERLVREIAELDYEDLLVFIEPAAEGLWHVEGGGAEGDGNPALRLVDFLKARELTGRDPCPLHMTPPSTSLASAR